MNKITVSGFIRDIQFSHDVGNVEYFKANLICPGTHGYDDDAIPIRFKKFCNKYKENDFVELCGNLRSYSHKEHDKNTVDIYVFTYFDLPDTMDNTVTLDGNICKIDNMVFSRRGKRFIHFTLANNMFCGNKKLNSYIPCTCYGKLADKMMLCKVGDKINLKGEFHSHTYKKKNLAGEIEIKVAHEVVVKEFEVSDG